MSSQAKSLFLCSLTSKSREWLTSRSVAMPLPLRKSLYQSRRVPPYAYFMTSGMASVVTSVGGGGTVEVGIIGREGVVGAFHLLGPARVPSTCFVQLEGTALRISLSHLREAFRSSEEIRMRLLELIQEQALTLGQLAGCNRLHQAEERLARWLLMVQDRIESDVLDLKQEFLGQMLGAQRTTVTAAAGVLQRAGLIEYRRGKLCILNRADLVAVACSCYEITRQLQTGLYKNDSE